MQDPEMNVEAENPSLLRALGLGMAVAIVVGNVIGSGIFAKPGEVAEAAQTFPLVITAWVVGGVLSFLGAPTCGHASQEQEAVRRDRPSSATATRASPRSRPARALSARAAAVLSARAGCHVDQSGAERRSAKVNPIRPL